MQKTLGWDPIIDCRPCHRARRGRPGRAPSAWSRAAKFSKLSGAPSRRTLHQTCREGNAHLAQAAPDSPEPLGIRFLGLGGSPKWTLPRPHAMPKSRYDII